MKQIMVHKAMNGLDIHNKTTKLLVRGNWNNGLNTGIDNLNLNNDTGNSNQTISTHLAWRVIETPFSTLQTVCLLLLERVKQTAQEGGEWLVSLEKVISSQQSGGIT